MTDNTKELLPDEIYAYHKEHGTGTWIDFDDSCHRFGDIATRYIRADLCAEPSDDTCTGCLCLTVHHTCGLSPDAKSVTDDAVVEALYQMVECLRNERLDKDATVAEALKALNDLSILSAGYGKSSSLLVDKIKAALIRPCVPAWNFNIDEAPEGDRLIGGWFDGYVHGDCWRHGEKWNDNEMNSMPKPDAWQLLPAAPTKGDE